jgi:hypothetical protein
VKITWSLGNCKSRLAALSLTALPIRAVFWWLFQVAIVPRQAVNASRMVRSAPSWALGCLSVGGQALSMRFAGRRRD